ncbi:MAG: hypothetical protein E6Q88_07475 [Lysobacteraceae bacterium]|nr:MAG: hypothetical protein E6Q88_07475 [Xanthomonadaceae bacterium]
MKRFMLVFAAIFTLGLGFGAHASAEPENACYATCQELRSDCLDQNPNGFVLCARIYRACLADCDGV